MADSGFLGTQTALNKTVYAKAFLERQEQTQAIHELAQRRRIPIGANKGDNIEFTQYLPQALVTSALTEGTAPTDDDFVTQTKVATLQEWGATTKTSSRFQFATFDVGMAELAGVKGQQAGESIELETLKRTMKYGVIPMRVDADSTYELHNQGVTSASGTSLVAAGLAGANDKWNGGVITITEGPGYGESRIVSDWVLGTTTITLDAAFDTTPTSASKFSIAVPTALAAGDVLTVDVLRRGQRQLERANYMPFEGGYTVCMIGPNNKYDLMDDADLKTLFSNHPNAGKTLFKNELAELWGQKITKTTMPYAYAVSDYSTYVKTGAAESVLFLGRNAVGVVEAEGRAMKMIFTKPEIAEPKLHMYGYMGWKAFWVCKPLNSTWAVSMMTYPSA